jgi:peroxiredoxin
MKMRFFSDLSLLALLASVFLSCSKEGYLIDGTADLPDGKAVLSYKSPSAVMEGVTVRDTVPFKKGHFRFKGKVEDVVRGVIYVIPDEGSAVASSIYVENAHVNACLDPSKAIDDGMFGDYLSIHEPDYKGGPNNEFFTAFNALGRDREARKKLIAESKDIEAAAFLSRIYFSDEPLEVFDTVFSSFTRRVQDSFLAQEAREELEARKRVSPGCVAPDFTLKDMDGKDVTLSSLRGQLVLIDFWASWCIPCREGMPGLKSLYAEYHGKGLEIIGVANDTDEVAWKKAISQDGTPWIHVKDEFPERGRPAKVVSSYAVHQIPAFFLIDRDGRILGQYDHRQLQEILSELIN